MAQIKDTLEDPRNFRTIDNYIEHDIHTEYDPHCSSCFALRNSCKSCMENERSEDSELCLDCIMEKKHEWDFDIWRDNEMAK